MKASELVKKLQEKIKKYGDKEAGMIFDSGSGDSNVEDVKYDKDYDTIDIIGE